MSSEEDEARWAKEQKIYQAGIAYGRDQILWKLRELLGITEECPHCKHRAREHD